MHTHVLNTFNQTGERPQGCQAREHAWRQLLKLVVAKVQIAVAKKDSEKIVRASNRHRSGAVLLSFTELTSGKITYVTAKY
jgi:hypothetical protein